MSRNGNRPNYKLTYMDFFFKIVKKRRLSLFRRVDISGLKAKLIFIMLLLSAILMVLLLAIYTRAERELIRQVERHTDELSAAIQISIEQLTNPSDEISDIKLKQYVERVKGKGIKEVSILTNEREVIASSNPALTGKVIDIKGDRVKTSSEVQEFMSIAKGRRNYDIFLPVVVGNEQFGFVHIAMQFDDFAELMHSNNIKRLFATGIVFVIGIITSVFLATRYTRPINNLSAAAEMVASGDLAISLPEKGGGEIKKLTEHFNKMVKGLSETKELEARLKEAEHLSTIGHLASGIAHEVRNPLNFINLSIAHIANKFSPDDERCKEEFINTINGIKGEVQRLNNMIVNFLDYGKPLKLKIQNIPLDTIIEDVLRVVEHKILEDNIIVEKRFSGDDLTAPVDAQQIKICILNLILNSIQAVEGNKGRIIVEASKNDEHIIIKVLDNGCGILEENLMKVYEPYFTTKEVGIGLGLSITKRIVEEHGGGIDIKSEYSMGTTAIIKLPAHKG